jgi:hypothetical protein
MSKKITIKNPKVKKIDVDDWVNTREGCKRFTMDLPISLHARLKIVSAKTGNSMGDIVKNLLEKNLSK